VAMTDHQDRDERVKLPLDPEEALRALLSVDPDSDLADDDDDDRESGDDDQPPVG